MKNVRLLFVFLFITAALSAQIRYKTIIPDIPGYKTLQCDFHTHTIFSDGSVMPAVRVDEAMQEGLDAIAITDHIEYRPWHRQNIVQSDHNKANTMALSHAWAKSGDVIVIAGTEITRDMPPGHWNAIFVSDVNPIDTPDYREALKIAYDQKAFIFWNHPGWERQAPDGIRWYDMHTEFYDKGYMMGIEVVNGKSYYPEAHQWALDKKLTMLGNTDIHAPMGHAYDFRAGQHRTMTLVFAKERNAAGIREALDARRTVVLMIGEETLLKELAKASLEIREIKRTETSVRIAVRNNSGLEFSLKKTDGDPNLNYQDMATLKPGISYTFWVTFKKPTTDKITLDFTIENFLSKPNQGMACKLDIPAYSK